MLAHPHRDYKAYTDWSSLLLSLTPFAVGVFISLKAGEHLRNGITNGLWPAEEVASFRGSFESVLWRAFCGTLLIGACVTM